MNSEEWVGLVEAMGKAMRGRLSIVYWAAENARAHETDPVFNNRCRIENGILLCAEKWFFELRR